MGLERMTAVLQGTHDNYKIDHLKKLLKPHQILLNHQLTKEPLQVIELYQII